ncbi:MAG: hypothetical protein ACXWQO_18465 [Bdellovibrionota bacterium]
MKQWFIGEYSELCKIDSSSELYRWFFRVVQICSALSLAWCLLFVMPMVAQIRAVPEYYGASISASWLASLWIIPVMQAVVAEICLRKVSSSFWAVAVGLFMAFCLLFTWAFPFGFLGLYSLLNKQFQRKYLGQAPAAFQEILSALKINYLEAKSDLAEPK